MFALLLAALMLGTPQPVAKLTWYGEEFVGRRHAASWHQQVPAGWPEVVNTRDLGIAAPYDIPFGTTVRITRIGNCYGEVSKRDGDFVDAVVVDRMAEDNLAWFDAWPATFEALGELEEGCLQVHVTVIQPVVWPRGQ